MSAKPKILLMSDNVLISTGMSTVLKEITLGLHATGKYNLVVGGWGYNSQQIHQFPVPIVGLSSADFGKGGFPQAGIMGLNDLISSMGGIDLLWALGDAWMVNYVAEIPNRKSFKFVQYTPCDGDPIPQYWIPWLSNPDQLVLYSKYGVDELKKVAPQIHPEMIYHGCHPNVYRPLLDDQKKDIRKKIMFWKVQGNQIVQGQGIPEDAFVVGSFSRNQPRKNFDKVIKAFAIFAKDKPNARLWLHSAIQDAAYNLADLAKMFGVEDKTYFTPGYNLVNGLSPENLNYLMNVLDVHFAPVQGEGFGLFLIETMAAGVPQVATDYTAHVEWCKNASEMIRLSGRIGSDGKMFGNENEKFDDLITGIPHPVERAIPKVSECVRALEVLYNNPSHRLQLAKNARAIAESMTWQQTIPQWEKVIDNVLAGKTNSNSVTGPSLGNEIVSQKKSAIEIVRI